MPDAERWQWWVKLKVGWEGGRETEGHVEHEERVTDCSWPRH